MNDVKKLKRSLEIITNIAEHYKRGGVADKICDDEMNFANELIDRLGGREFTVEGSK